MRRAAAVRLRVVVVPHLAAVALRHAAAARLRAVVVPPRRRPPRQARDPAPLRRLRCQRYPAP
jgi:hypothetical protein